ncbi:Protein CBG26562 [Caenorhabditis briggsae]|uniref:Protein CBG26562 n=1 Tax=Caenorhabditis briggsae TaxID=6238 RepID=B6IGZ6_CAEBR|nr:Protein CBG26562 [Caenorhabditis briggsae]CAR99176.1 Protein CBG26562 [Caenorhabditis briggsae]
MPLTAKEQLIAQGKKVDKKEYQTMNDVESDWGDDPEKEEKKE